MNSISSSRNTIVQARPRQRRNSFLLRTGRVLLRLLVLIAGIAGIGATYQTIATAIDRRAYPPPGRLVDVGGYRLHLTCLGQGSPTVVLEGAMFASSAMWSWVQPDLASHTRVCVYDRAGMGWSDSGPSPRDAARAAAELHTLLHNAGEPGPYVLVGHSLGGAATRVFAAAHPDLTAGLVLLDATHPDVLTLLPAELAAKFTPSEAQLRLVGALARVGIARTLHLLLPNVSDLPPASRQAVTALNLSTRSIDAITAELRAIPDSLAQARAAGTLGSTPLLVLSAETTYAHDPSAQAIWERLQQDLATLSTNSVRRIVPGTTHESLVYSKAGARSTAEAILYLVEAIRTDQPLH